MTTSSSYNWLLISWIIVQFLVLINLVFQPAFYGRYAKKGTGASVPAWLGWIIMEIPTVTYWLWLFVFGRHRGATVSLVFFLMWLAHYVHRTLIYPFVFRGRNKQMPLLVAGMGFIFQMVNTHLNGRYLFHLADPYPTNWLTSWQFILGFTIFVAGYIINRHSDSILRNLRAPGETGYKIPYGGLYKYISAPNYFGEILIWLGWAIATWSIPGAAFALMTLCNLAPRAFTHHNWYKETFDNYPTERKALIPFVR